MPWTIYVHQQTTPTDHEAGCTMLCQLTSVTYWRRVMRAIFSFTTPYVSSLLPNCTLVVACSTLKAWGGGGEGRRRGEKKSGSWKGVKIAFTAHSSCYCPLHSPSKCCSHSKAAIVEDVHGHFETITLVCTTWTKTLIMGDPDRTQYSGCNCTVRTLHFLPMQCGGLEKFSTTFHLPLTHLQSNSLQAP